VKYEVIPVNDFGHRTETSHTKTFPKKQTRKAQRNKSIRILVDPRHTTKTSFLEIPVTGVANPTNIYLGDVLMNGYVNLMHVYVID
jgi:hypothetical protein